MFTSQSGNWLTTSWHCYTTTYNSGSSSDSHASTRGWCVYLQILSRLTQLYFDSPDTASAWTQQRTSPPTVLPLLHDNHLRCRPTENTASQNSFIVACTTVAKLTLSFMFHCCVTVYCTIILVIAASSIPHVITFFNAYGFNINSMYSINRHMCFYTMNLIYTSQCC
jgi:hypothetical protein